jgi:azobenzene reductase
MGRPEPLRVLIMPGSVRRPSHSVALAHKIAQTFSAPFEASVLSNIVLPPADPRFHKNPLEHELDEIRELAEVAQAADAFVWVSPIYHNSYSSHLKTLLDHLAIRQFSNKVVGLASHGGNRSPQAVDHLRIVARGLNAITTPSNVCTADSDYGEALEGFEVIDTDVLGRVERLVAEVSVMTLGLRSMRPTA